MSAVSRPAAGRNLRTLTCCSRGSVAVAVTNCPVAAVKRGIVGVARAVGRHGRRAQERRTFAVAGRVARRVAEELDPERGVRRAVERALHAAGSRREHREVLQAVRARIAVAGIIGGYAVGVEIDSKRAVGADGIAKNPVVRAPPGPRARPRSVLNAMRFPAPAARPPMVLVEAVLSTLKPTLTPRAVGQCGGACNVGTDEVALDDIRARAVAQQDSRLIVAGDDVSDRWRQAAHEVGFAGHAQCRRPVPDIERACAIGADQVALDAVVRSRWPQRDSDTVSRNDVACSGDSTTDGVAGGFV